MIERLVLIILVHICLQPVKNVCIQ